MAAISQTQANWTMVPPLPSLTPRPTYTPAPTIAIEVVVEVTRLVEITQTFTPTPLYTPTITPTATDTQPPTNTPDKTQTALAQVEARLRNPKGDGFYLVGVDIAAGIWRSTGTEDDCYWAVTDRTGDILDNHFGMAGGTAYVSASAFQVQFEDCGRWEFVSPP
ncbi:MAG TPA: hypothetical protein PL117_03250 [Accumulibacter sp.]|uniref:hypothetical protein n=1 Tax=Accumulibacter sp. TaxID=2053492 RepID=UPI002CB2144B|nr:hypothetical protein [Accumulibacter sp.]HRF71764.1 hypothetical protein [Accumulibacter sp.]